MATQFADKRVGMEEEAAVGFYGADPIPQPGSIADAGATFDPAVVNAILTVLRDLGLIARP